MAATTVAATTASTNKFFFHDIHHFTVANNAEIATTSIDEANDVVYLQYLKGGTLVMSGHIQTDDMDSATALVFDLILLDTDLSTVRS
jgi:hypothetical protein